MNKIGIATLCAVALSVIGLSTTSPAAPAGGKKPAGPPDLTRGGVPDETHDYRLGPTGLQGWMWNRHMKQGATRDARQVLVTWIDPGSPADGKVQAGDVILGIDGKPFARDARKALAAAIDEAETRDAEGRLPLTVWRDGKTREVVLTLQVLGRYSDTAPYDCAKTAAIVDRACAYLKDKPLADGWQGYIAALGLLATGRQDVLPKLRDFAHEICVPGEVLNVETHESMLCWKWAYKTLFLSEYYLLTRDETVLPTLNEYDTKIAMGQSGVGTWGHTVAARANTGYLHGHLGGYGAMNQISTVLMMDLALAGKCGIKNGEIDRGLRMGEQFFSFYIGKGAIPYGDHRPNNQWFDDNGKCSEGAVMFDLLGNKPGADFFSSMVVGSSPGGRETGHTGCFWSHLWGGMGAARSGEKGLAAFFRQMRWYFTLERGWDGSMAFQGNVGDKGKRGEPKGKGWDCTGARLLQLCLPRKKLYITGKGMIVAHPLDGARLDEALAGGRFITDPEALGSLKQEEIFKMLASPLPPIRLYGAKALAGQEIRCVDELLAMLDGDDPNARYGACDALAVAGYESEEAVAHLVRTIETSDSLALRLNAIDALIGRDKERGLVAAAKPAIPALLRVAVQHLPDDPRRQLQRKLCFALFYSGRALPYTGLIPLHGLDGVDHALLIPAIRELLTVDDGRARGCIAWVYPKLTAADLQQLWGDIYRATRDISPSGIMFADGVRIRGLKLMQQHNVKEGVTLCTSILSESRWGAGHRQKGILPILAAYGPAAKSTLPVLQKMEMKDRTQLDKTLQAIEKGQGQPLVSIAPYL